MSAILLTDSSGRPYDPAFMAAAGALTAGSGVGIAAAQQSPIRGQTPSLPVTNPAHDAAREKQISFRNWGAAAGGSILLGPRGWLHYPITMRARLRGC